MYQHILAAVDGSAPAGRALEDAITLAKEQRAHLRILHVIDQGPVWGLEYVDPTQIWKAMADHGRKILERSAAEAAKHGVNAETRLIETQVPGRRIAEVIAEEAQAGPADLIGVGTHGRHGLSRALLGSVAEGVIRSTQRTVLLVHHNGAPDAPGTVAA